MSAVRYAGHSWPAAEPAAVVLVCRSSHRGLSSAQDLARQYRDSDLAGITLLGLVVSADAPGRLPPPLKRLDRLVAGAIPILGRVPWMAQWRLGAAIIGDQAPAWLTELTAALATAQQVSR